MTLDQLKPVSKCRIKKLSAESLIGQRLMSMGMHPGTILNIIRNAPLEDPMEIRIEGSSISLRHEEAVFVEVEKI